MDKARAAKVLEQVARENGVDVETVIREIECAIREAMDTDDVNVCSLWERIPRRGVYPTAVEMVAYLGDSLDSVI